MGGAPSNLSGLSSPRPGSLRVCPAGPYLVRVAGVCLDQLVPVLRQLLNILQTLHVEVSVWLGGCED